MLEEQDILLEREKLKDIIVKLTEEENKIEDSLYKNLISFQKDEKKKKQLESIEKKKIEKIRDIKSNPYFARIDFKEEGKKKTQTFYIGKKELKDSQNNENLVIDWRESISSLYYDEKIGKVSYNTSEDEIFRKSYSKKTISN